MRILRALNPERIGLCVGLAKTGKALLITSVFSNIIFNFAFYSMLWGGVKVIRLLSFTNYIPFSFYLGHSGHSYSSGRYSFCGKRPLAIAAGSESMPTHDRDITPLNQRFCVIFAQLCGMETIFWENGFRACP